MFKVSTRSTTTPKYTLTLRLVSNVPRSGYITARDQSMVESGVTLGEKNTAMSCQFSFS